MTANELMIGDLVQNMVHHIYCKVDIDALERLPEWPLNPIPLTAEILEKNGFERHEDTVYYMDYYHTRDGFTIFNCRTWHECILESVHELQHALRLCGLTELADNFKI